MAMIEVELGARSYPVVFGRSFSELVAHLPAFARGVVLTDSNVGPLYASALQRGLPFPTSVVGFEAGERHKTPETWLRLVNEVLDLGIDRKTVILALGGGVVGDMAGFLAASALRGLPFVQVPTSLLAMVDSSVGGKTGVNTVQGKNLLGAFHQPQAVLVNTSTLRTLPPRELRAGLGEVIKTALLDSEEALERVERLAPRLSVADPEAIEEVVALCVRAKAAVVARDELESGVRATLNAGHTVGHALERALGYGELLHGEAVGVGLVAEIAWAVSEGLCQDSTLPDRVSKLLRSVGLPFRTPPASQSALEKAIRVDKKANVNRLTVPVPIRIGEWSLHTIPLDQGATLLEFLP